MNEEEEFWKEWDWVEALTIYGMWVAAIGIWVLVFWKMRM